MASGGNAWWRGAEEVQREEGSKIGVEEEVRGWLYL
jgi:hypothetical protein